MAFDRRFVITSIPLWKDSNWGTGSTNNSDPIDMRDIAAQGKCSLSYRLAGSGGAATAGTVAFTYQVSNVGPGGIAGTGWITPGGKSGTEGTIGTTLVATNDAKVFEFTPVLAPWMRIRGMVGTSAPVVMSAELNVV